MELDDLKHIWKKQEGAFRQKGESEIASMLKGTSTSLVQKLKRSVWVEFIITAIAGVILLVYAITLPSGSIRSISISILVVFVLYYVYYIKKLLLLNTYGTNGGNIKSNLESLISKLSGYLRFYKRSYTILYPVYFILGLLFGGLESGYEAFLKHLIQPRTIALLLLTALLFYFCSTWLINWLLKRLYGNYLDKLREILADLNRNGFDET